MAVAHSSQNFPRWKQQLPMYATYSRIALAPVLWALFQIHRPWVGALTAGLFIIGSLTDWLDGYWARLYQSESAMGKFMDPIADKIMVLATLIALVEKNLVGSLPVILLLSRDIFIGGLRSIAAVNQVVIAAKPFGKWKTGVQMVAIPLLLVDQSLPGFSLNLLGLVLLWLSVGLSLLSGAEYTIGYYRERQTLPRANRSSAAPPRD